MWRAHSNKVLVVLGVLLALTVLLAAGVGAMKIYPRQLFELLLVRAGLMESGNFSAAQEAVFWSIRLPRVVVGALVGAGLSLAGASLQGLFRNPLADPGIIGVSAGGSLAASIAIVFGIHFSVLGYFGLSVITFFGAVATTWLVYLIARSNGKALVATMLLAGIAIDAIARAGTGLMTFVSDDAELRTISFWLLGSLGGANWHNAAALLPFITIPALFIPYLGKQLNAFALGESDASYLGVRVSVLKVTVITLSTMAVGASVAVAGAIAFVGLIVPHILRLIVGPDYRILLPGSMILGAMIMLLSDVVSRTVLAPQELPLGIITAVIGAPLFVSILLREKKRHGLAA